MVFFNDPKVLGVPMPQILDQIVDVPKLIPQERIQQRTLEETVNVPFQQIQEQIVAVVRAVLIAVDLFSSF